MQVSFVSLLAANADVLYKQLILVLNQQLGLDISIIDTVAWQERARLLRQGEISFGAVCGAVYARWSEQSDPPVQLLAAPVMAAVRYRNLPVYFSDLLVRRDSPARCFADLRDKTLVYNEPESFSGYAVLCAYLAVHGETRSFFGQAHQSGSHLASLHAVLAGEADVTAIDSIVFERACRLDPTIASRVRSVQTLGPNPVPPLVVNQNLPAQFVTRLRAALLGMHQQNHGRRALDEAGIERFVQVADDDYAPIRHQLALANAVRL